MVSVGIQGNLTYGVWIEFRVLVNGEHPPGGAVRWADLCVARRSLWLADEAHREKLENRRSPVGAAPHWKCQCSGGTMCPETSGIAFYGVFAIAAMFVVNFIVFSKLLFPILSIGAGRQI